MLKALGFRLGFVLCLSLVIRVVGVLSPHQPKPPGQMVGVSDRYGDGHLPPADPAGMAPTSGKTRSAFGQQEQSREISFEPGQPMIDPTPRR
ncbi:MAG: hypothetical protein JO276_15355 [Sphingomonadaceae bacterium]|nr:hypothetical protein [Sphingomonadaceae bacterium]